MVAYTPITPCGDTLPDKPGQLADEHLAATQLLLGMIAENDDLTVVQITGLVGAEGTSTVATSIAQSLHHVSGAQVCNLRIMDTTEVAEPRPDDAAPPRSGTLQHGTMRRILTRGLHEGLGELPASVRCVLLETPPILAGVEGAAVSRHVHGTILVLEGDASTYASAHEAQQAIERSGGRLLGVVLNKRKYRVPRFIARFLNIPSSKARSRSFWPVLVLVTGLAAGLGYVMYPAETDPVTPIAPTSETPVGDGQ